MKLALYFLGVLMILSFITIKVYNSILPALSILMVLVMLLPIYFYYGNKFVNIEILKQLPEDFKVFLIEKRIISNYFSLSMSWDDYLKEKGQENKGKKEFEYHNRAISELSKSIKEVKS
jgi:hypothetical protein